MIVSSSVRPLREAPDPVSERIISQTAFLRRTIWISRYWSVVLTRAYTIRAKCKIRHIRVALAVYRHIERKPTLLLQTTCVTQPYNSTDERRVGKEWDSRCRYGWAWDNQKKK